MEPPFIQRNAHLAFLEPPHLHDPAQVSEALSLPLPILATMPESIRIALHNLEQSTSILYASYARFQELLQQRFDRLLPFSRAENKTEFSELSFFNYTNSLHAERTYFRVDARPDWRHKANLARLILRSHLASPNGTHPSDVELASTVSQWQARLHSTVTCWAEHVEAVYIPEYEDTISEFLAIHNQTPSLVTDLDDTPLGSPFEAPTPVSAQRHEPLPLIEIKPQNFDSSMFREREEAIYGLGLGTIVEEKPLSTRKDGVPPMEGGRAREERKDSGIALTDQA